MQVIKKENKGNRDALNVRERLLIRNPKLKVVREDDNNRDGVAMEEEEVTSNEDITMSHEGVGHHGEGGNGRGSH